MEYQCKCPFCPQRLFDVASIVTGVIEIKCPLCKQIARINFDNPIKKNRYLIT